MPALRSRACLEPKRRTATAYPALFVISCYAAARLASRRPSRPSLARTEERGGGKGEERRGWGEGKARGTPRLGFVVGGRRAASDASRLRCQPAYARAEERCADRVQELQGYPEPHEVAEAVRANLLDEGTNGRGEGCRERAVA